jgi:hypothetical protein
MRTTLVCLCFGLAKLCLAKPDVLSLSIFKNHQKHAQALRKRNTDNVIRRTPFSADLQNYPYVGGGFYYINATVGDPPQVVSLDIDTGSSEVWTFAVNTCGNDNDVCIGGSFNETASKTATVIDKGGFQIQYFTQGSNVTGDYITDSFTIGGRTMKNMTMGIAKRAISASTGVMGLSFDRNEAMGEADPKSYPSVMDVMKQQGLISTRAYSLYLNDLAADTGSIVFGGYDKAKFKGDLAILEIQRDSYSKTYSSFAVILNSIGVTDSNGSIVLTTSNMPNVLALDSGSAFTIIPFDLLIQLVKYFGAVQDFNGSWVVRCDLNGMTGTLDYQFAGPTGPVISVAFKELAIPLVDHDTGDRLTDSDDNPLCFLGLLAPTEPNEPLLLGDTFLRSAYVVYDLDNLQVGIAQTIFNVTDSNIEAISASGSQNLPGTIASAVSVIAQTNTQVTGGGTGVTNVGLTAVGSTSGAAALTGVKTTYAMQTTDIPSTSSPGAGASTSPPKKADGTALQGSMGGYGKSVLVQGMSLLVALLMGRVLAL